MVEPAAALPAGMTAGEHGALSVPTRTGMDGFFLCAMQKKRGKSCNETGGLFVKNNRRTQWNKKRCISSFTLAELTAELKAMGQPGFRAKQIFHWVHQKLVTEFSAMTDQPKTLLAKLEESFYIAAPKIERRQEAKDGTVKYLLRMADGNCIETVVMRYHYGNTVCVSTQVGCRMGCRFCASTQAGRVRDLEAGEICSEIYTAQKDIGERISHIVLMGIGEPLDNFDEVMKFLENITSPEGVNIGMRNISLSTCGWCPRSTSWPRKSCS